MGKKIKIAVCGSEGVIDTVRDSLKAIDIVEVVDPDDLSGADIIYWIYGRGPSIIKYPALWIRKDPLIINHWIGSDVLDEMEKTPHGLDWVRNFIQDAIVYWKRQRGGLLVLAGAPWLVGELSKMYIQATYLPLTTIDVDILGSEDSGTAKDIDFLSYVPFGRFEFYGGDKIVELARKWRNYSFLIICVDLDQIPADFIAKMPENLHFIPRVDISAMPRLYQRSKFFIRYTKHDSESVSVFEALYFNLQVLWTYEFPHTHKIESYETLSDQIPSLVENWQPNSEGHAFIIEHFSIEKWRSDFLALLQNNYWKK